MWLSRRNDLESALGADRARERGSSVVEFALIFTLFFVMVGVVVQGAFLFNAWLVITNATREAARAGAPCINRTAPYNCLTSDVVTVAKQAVAGAVDSSQFSATATVITDSSGTQLLAVRATYSVPILAPFVAAFFPSDPIPISAVSTMRLENQGN